MTLEPGLQYESKQIVKESDTAAAFGSGDLYVFSTPMMIGLMENAALKAAQQALEEGLSTVGIRLEVDHLAATPLGMEVRAVATLEEVAGKKLKFRVEAYDEEGLIGEGYHWRYVIQTEKFMQRVSDKRKV
jgi:predicted thioesterase